MLGAGGSWVLDRTWYEDAEVFARGLYEQGYMSSDDWSLYRQLYGELLHAPAARPPRLLVYLQGPLDVILERIATRGRPKERDTEVAYWRDLHARYERWIQEFRYCPVLTLDVRDYDLLTDPRAIEAVVARVRDVLGDELPQTEFWPPTHRPPAWQRS
jgi:deoxyadenosine/deoxycytidine kinase